MEREVRRGCGHHVGRHAREDGRHAACQVDEGDLRVPDRVLKLVRWP